MSYNAKKLLKKYHGSRLAVAEVFILGEIKPDEEAYVSELVDMITLEAARIRLDATGWLTSADIKLVRKTS